MRVITRCSREAWLSRYAAAYEADPRMQAACHTPATLGELAGPQSQFLSVLDETGHIGGYAITKDGRMLGVHSSVRGIGWWLLLNASMDGASTLQTFADSAMHKCAVERGWQELEREPNWTEGAPDYVTMRSPVAQAA